MAGAFFNLWTALAMWQKEARPSPITRRTDRYHHL
jgi:hypothetical protein